MSREQQSTNHARRITVTGRVQGVGYRAWAAETAQTLGLSGWVRNRLDGSVEMVARGEPQRIAELVERCREGPRLAHVGHVSVEPSPGIVATGFFVKPTV